MHNKKTLTLSLLMTLGVSITSFSFIYSHQNFKKVEAISTSGCTYLSTLPTSIDLNDVDDDEIRAYYSNLNDLDESELTGTNLLKNLKPILKEMNYFSYDNIWKIYEITDRDWELSPAIEDVYGDYNSETNIYSHYSYSSSNTNTKNNPYVHTLYRNPGNADGYITNWGDHDVTGTNREHVWCQSRGFKASKGAEGPAGTDLHHLKSGDGRVNQTHHNNNPYGYVKTQDSQTISYNEQYPFLSGNKRGTALHTSSNDKSSVVFEPQDCDKGDIARACFYMVARYNNLSGTDTISQFEPNLTLVNYATSNNASEISSDTTPVSMGILQDLLEWNKLDPVDDYEIHRNNLIYKNYQGNRNPFIDFPQWADYIWGTCVDGNYSATPTGSADYLNDKIASTNLKISKYSVNIAPNESISIFGTTADDSAISWTLEDDNLVSIDKTSTASLEKITITAGNKEGTTTLVASATIDGEELNKTINIKVAKVKTQAIPYLYIIIGVAVAFVLVVIFIVISSKSKKNGKGNKKIQTQMKKVATKAIKNATKSNSNSKAKKKS